MFSRRQFWAKLLYTRQAITASLRLVAQSPARTSVFAKSFRPRNYSFRDSIAIGAFVDTSRLNIMTVIVSFSSPAF